MILLGLLLALATPPSDAPPDVTALARDTVAKETKMFNDIEKHCFTMRIFQEETGDNPHRKQETRLEHVCFRDGVPVYQRLEINGKPTGAKATDPFPPPDDEWRKRAEKIRESHKTQIDIMQQCLKAFNFTFVNETTFEGRPAIVIDIKPNPRYDATSRTTELLKSVSGRAWIDKETHNLMRIEAKTFKDFALWGGMIVRIKEGGWFVMRQKELDGEWFPYFMESSWEGKLAMVKRIGDHYRLERFGFERGSADKPAEKK
jgi:hypothetical protein